MSTSRSALRARLRESGLPILPQAIVRWPHAFNICASNSVVVVFAVRAGDGDDREFRTERQPKLELADRLDFARGKIPRQRRDRIDARTQDDKIDRGTNPAPPPARNAPPLRALADFRCVDLSRVLLFGAIEHGDLRALRLEAGAPRQSRSVPLPEPQLFLSLYRTFYLNFSVANPSSAKMADRIQNRTMTVFSFQPVSSK